MSATKMSIKWKIGLGVFIIFIVIGIPVTLAFIWGNHIEQEIQKFYDRGCTPTGTASWTGQPTTWLCPVK